MTDPAALSAQARELLARNDSSFAGLWQRSAAFLARQALEVAVAKTLASRASGTERVSARAQLLCLASFVAAEIAHEATYLWTVLSRACHHHPYELAPTWDELSSWLTQTDFVIARLSDAGASAPVSNEADP